MKELEDILLLAIRPLMEVTNVFHERSMSDVSVKPDSQMLVDSLGLVSQVIYKVNMLRVRNFISPEKNEPYHHNSFDGAINLDKISESWYVCLKCGPTD